MELLIMFKKSIIAVAVATASCGALASAWEDPVLEFNGTNNQAMEEAYTKFVYNAAGLPSGLSELTEGETGYITSPDLTQPNGKPNYGGAPVFLQANASTNDVINKGKIWVVSGTDANAAYVMEAMGTAGGGKTAVNEGVIFVDGKNMATSYSRIKGMTAITGSVTNKNLIVVKGGATAMMDNSRQDSLERSLINEGRIEIVDSGVGIYYRKETSNTRVENNGSIVANGDESIAVWIDNEKEEAGNNKVFTNTGTIQADSGIAILVNDTAKNSVVNLNGESDVDGLVDLNGTTTLNFVNNTDTISLKDDVGTINIDENSDATIKQGSTSTVNVGTLNGRRAKFAVEHITEGQKSIAIGTNNAEETTVDFSANVVDAYSAQEIAEAMSGAVDLNVAEGNTGSLNGYGTNFTASVDAVTGEMAVEASDLTQSTVDMAVASAVAWRNEITTLNDRMSTLRTSPSQYGAWARYNGGEYKYDDRHMDNQFNTIEVGGDARIGNGPWTVGASFAYTQGEGDFVNGSTESDTYSGALYAMWNHEGGSFVDMVAKVGSLKSDYDFYNLVGGAFDKGSLDRTGYIFGIETGHRFTVSDSFYVEPQVQLVYSSLSSESETTAHRTIDVDTTDSLVGRIGVMAGMNYAMGSAYVRVSGLRDFTGEVDGSFTTNGNTYKMSQDMDDSWVEFAIGTNLKVSDNFYVFADVQKSTGGDIDLDWRANVGAKLFF